MTTLAAAVIAWQNGPTGAGRLCRAVTLDSGIIRFFGRFDGLECQRRLKFRRLILYGFSKNSNRAKLAKPMVCLTSTFRLLEYYRAGVSIFGIGGAGAVWLSGNR